MANQDPVAPVGQKPGGAPAAQPTPPADKAAPTGTEQSTAVGHTGATNAQGSQGQGGAQQTATNQPDHSDLSPDAQKQLDDQKKAEEEQQQKDDEIKKLQEQIQDLQKQLEETKAKLHAAEQSGDHSKVQQLHNQLQNQQNQMGNLTDQVEGLQAPPPITSVAPPSGGQAPLTLPRPPVFSGGTQPGNFMVPGGMGMPGGFTGNPGGGVQGGPGAAVPANPNVQIPSFGPNPDKAQIGQMLDAASQKYGVPDNILKAVAWQESGWNPKALSFDGQHGKGVMQIDDRFHAFAKTPDVFDPQKNIDYGANMLSGLYKQYGSWQAALKHYNGGDDYPPKVLALAQSQPWQKYA